MSVFSRRIILIGLCLMLGCSNGEPAEKVEESDRMLNVLTTALDAWTERAVATLAGHDPAIRFVDDDLVAGWELKEYSFQDPDALIRPFDDVEVNLTLWNTQGKTVEKKVAYQIVLTPPVAVLRSEP